MGGKDRQTSSSRTERQTDKLADQQLRQGGDALGAERSAWPGCHLLVTNKLQPSGGDGVYIRGLSVLG